MTERIYYNRLHELLFEQQCILENIQQCIKDNDYEFINEFEYEFNIVSDKIRVLKAQKNIFLP